MCDGFVSLQRDNRRRSNRLSVSSASIARVIGRGGVNINAIREATGAHIEVEKQQTKKEQMERMITIRGAPEAIRSVRMGILANAMLGQMCGGDDQRVDRGDRRAGRGDNRAYPATNRDRQGSGQSDCKCDHEMRCRE
jgi:polyribonucleotide nucleotidyltransferase